MGYSLKEAISHFFRNWTTSLGAVITIFLSLFIIGLFIMGSAMLNSVIGTVEDQVVINAFISDDADQADVQAFEAELETWSNVKSVTYKDKDLSLIHIYLLGESVESNTARSSKRTRLGALF